MTVRSSDYGRILFDGSSHALYAFTRDTSGKSTCYGPCARAWPPYIARGNLQAGSGATRSLLGTTTRRDGRRQLTYAGKPLYFYVHEARGRCYARTCASTVACGSSFGRAGVSSVDPIRHFLAYGPKIHSRLKVGVPGRLVGKVFPWTSTLTSSPNSR